MVAKLWVNHGLDPNSVVNAPPAVLRRALFLLRKQNSRSKDEADFARLHARLKGA